jgi:hypothetical protein
MEENAPQNQRCWHSLLPQMSIATAYQSPRFVTCCIKLSPQTKLWHQVSAATGKNVVTSHMVAAIAHFIATIAFLWQ